jgi:DNA-binding XRE family transcriptional regulator
MREWLKKLREEKGLRQFDMAKKLDCSVQQYNFIENG